MVDNGYHFPERLFFDVLTITHLYVVVKHQDVLTFDVLVLVSIN